MNIKAIHCPAEDNGKVMSFYSTQVCLANAPEVRLWVSSISRDYVFPYGNADYVVTKFHFYDPEGRVYTINKGYFEDANGAKYPGISFRSQQKHLKRIILTNDFSWQKAYDDNFLFFISRGKVGNSKPRAEVYIPFSYLRSLGFSVEVTERNFINEYNKPETLQTARLVTPMFSMVLESEYRVR